MYVPRRVLFREVTRSNYNHLKSLGQVEALRRLGAKVVWIPPSRGLDIMNRVKPDLLIASHLTQEDLSRIETYRKRQPLRVVNYDANPVLFEAPRLVDLVYTSFDVTDENASTVPPDIEKSYNRDRYRRAGIKMLFCPLAADPELFKPIRAVVHHDVAFAGTLRNRPLIRSLPTMRPKLRLDFRGPDSSEGVLGPRALSQMYATAAICPNVHGPETHACEVNIRTFEIAMAGGLQLVDLRERVSQFFSEREVVFYDSDDEFFELLDYYLSNPGLRDSFMVAAHERALTEHTWDARVAQLVGALQ